MICTIHVGEYILPVVEMFILLLFGITLTGMYSKLLSFVIIMNCVSFKVILNIRKNSSFHT